MGKYKLKTEYEYFALVEFEYEGHPSDLYHLSDFYDSSYLHSELKRLGAKNIAMYSKHDLGDGFELYSE